MCATATEGGGEGGKKREEEEKKLSNVAEESLRLYTFSVSLIGLHSMR